MNMLDRHNEHKFLEHPDLNGNSFIYNVNKSANNIDEIKRFNNYIEEGKIAELVEAVLVGIEETGNKWLVQLQEVALALTAAKSAFNFATLITIPEDITSGAEIELPDLAQYTVGTHMLMVSYNGTTCYIGEQYEEIGEIGETSKKIRMLFDLRANDKIMFRVIALNSETILDKLPVKAEGSTEYRILEERFSDIINVKDFGAKGDGVTDDTEAIQAAFDYHVKGKHGGKILFPNGTYIVSDSLILKNRNRSYTLNDEVYSTQWPHVDLCGSSIAWHGPDNEKPVLIISVNNGLIENGQILGAPKNAEGDQHRALCCIKITNEYGSPFAFRMDNMQLNGYTRCGLMIGDEAHLGSYGCQVSNTYITANNSIDDWENNGPAGIELWGADCKFVNVTTQRNKRHVWLHTSGHQFTNCHFVSTTKNQSKNAAMPETAAIWYSLRSTAAWYQNTFIGCYFDNVKYVIYNDKSHATVTQLTGCFYFNAGTVFDISHAPAEAYLLGGPSDTGSPVHVCNFSVQPSSYIRFISGIDAGLNYSMLCNEDYSQDNNLKATIACPWLAKFKVKNNQPVRLTTGGSDKFSSNEIRCIGGVLLNDLNKAEFKVILSNRIYGVLDVTFKNVGASSEWICDIHSMFGVNIAVELSVHEPLDVNIRGTEMKFIPICVKNIYPSGEWSGALYGSISSPIAGIGMYLVHVGSIRFNLDALSSDSGITISKTPLIKACIQTNIFGGLPLLPNEESSTVTKNIDTIRTSGTYPILCDSTTIGAPFEGYGILEVFSVGPRAGISPNPMTYQRVTQINKTTLFRKHRRIAGENGSSISAWTDI